MDHNGKKKIKNTLHYGLSFHKFLSYLVIMYEKDKFFMIQKVYFEVLVEIAALWCGRSQRGMATWNIMEVVLWMPVLHMNNLIPK